MSIALRANPVVIIGAGRSGTNMLRDILSSVAEVTTWPCDEINYVWRHGNRSYPSDEFTPDMARPDVVNFIRGAFNREVERATKQTNSVGPSIVLEKTCANSLRVPFVKSVLPEAKFIHILRDGRDVVASAQKRWTAPLDLSYIMAKARYVPVSDLPYYALRYGLNRFRKLFSREKSLQSWGPRISSMRNCSRELSVEQVCAEQWARCVELSRSDFENIEKEKIFSVRYEELISDPVGNIANMLSFMGLQCSDDVIESACEDVRRVPSLHKKVPPDLAPETLAVLQPWLEILGYD